jgi:hypothetical protein
MGTTLTGTTPQDTYDSLIKVTDNGPLSGTAKYLSDGLGNDSALALSTTSVGIGTATPDQKLNIVGSQTTAYATSSGSEVIPLGGVNMTMQNTGTGGFTSMRFVSLNSSNAIGYLGFTNTTSSIGGAFVFGQRSGGGYAEQVRINESGNVGIGTSSPVAKLSVINTASFTGGTNYSTPHLLISGNSSYTSGNVTRLAFAINGDGNQAYIDCISTDSGGNSSDLAIRTRGTGGVGERVRILANGGLTFNGDTAAANALDDYEEGTWTMGVSFGGGTTGITYNANSGTYTKVGRKVTISGYIALSAKGSSTGNARITGLPFTSLSGDSNLTAVTLWYNNTTFVGQFQGLVRTGQNYIDLTAITESGSISSISDTNFANNTEIILNVTYFV